MIPNIWGAFRGVKVGIEIKKALLISLVSVRTAPVGDFILVISLEAAAERA